MIDPLDVGVVLPFWLDRPEPEALEIALAADALGFRYLWVGEMATHDAFALAGAVAVSTRLRICVGPLAVGVRSPVALALGLASVTTLGGRPADLALGAANPAIVEGWHDRPWSPVAARTREMLPALATLLRGERLQAEGRHVRSRGFRLRSALPDATLTAAAFGPAMTRAAAELADRVVLNLVTPERVAEARAQIDAAAVAAGREPPPLAVWVPVALRPAEAAERQLAEQLAAYLGAPGYGEMLGEIGHGDLVQRARAGARRHELAEQVPPELIRAVCAVGAPEEIRARLDEYRQAGADHVGVAPSTAEDPAGREVLAALARVGLARISG